MILLITLTVFPVAERLNEFRTANGKAWDDIKAGMDSAMDELDQAFDRARSHFEG
jgi:hypothetical protein